MRVLYLNPFSQQVSGPDESLITLLGALVPLGIEPHVVLPKPGPAVERYEKLGAKVWFAPLSVLKRRMGILDILAFGPRLARGVAAIVRIARRERIDLIHTNMEVVVDGALAAWLVRVPHVLHYRGNTLDRPKVVFDLLTRFWTRTAKRVFCISRATADIFYRRGLQENVEVLYNPVDVAAFAVARRSDEIRQQLGARPGDLLLGTVGRIHPRKDITTFLEAGALVAKQRPDVRLTVIGVAEAPEELRYLEDLKKLAERLGIEGRLEWAGARRDIPDVLKALDALVLCSRNEGFGRVVAEAMAAGTRVVAANEGAMPELASLALGSVVLAEPASPRHFAEAALSLYGRPAPDPRSSRAFDPTRLAQTVVRAYSRACSHAAV